MNPETQAWLEAHPEGLHVERPGAEDWRMVVFDEVGAEVRGVYAVDPPSRKAWGYRCDPKGRFVVGPDDRIERRTYDASGWVLVRDGLAIVVGASHHPCATPGCVLRGAHHVGLMPKEVPAHPDARQLAEGLLEAQHRVSRARYRAALQTAGANHPEAMLGSVDRGESAFVAIYDQRLCRVKDVCVVDRWGRMAQRMGRDGSSFGWFSLDGHIGITRHWRRLPFGRSPGPGVMAAFLVAYAAAGERSGRIRKART